MNAAADYMRDQHRCQTLYAGATFGNDWGGNFALLSRGMIDEQFYPRNGNGNTTISYDHCVASVARRILPAVYP